MPTRKKPSVLAGFHDQKEDPLPPDPPSIREIVEQGLTIELFAPLEEADATSEEDLGITLPHSLRQAYHLVANLSYQLVETQVAGQSLAQKIPELTKLTIRWPEFLTHTAASRIETMRLKLLLEQASSDFAALFHEKLKLMDYNLHFIREGYRVTRLTLPAETSWIELIPKASRPAIAFTMYSQQMDPLQTDKNLALTMLSDLGPTAPETHERDERLRKKALRIKKKMAPVTRTTARKSGRGKKKKSGRTRPSISVKPATSRANGFGVTGTTRQGFRFFVNPDG